MVLRVGTETPQPKFLPFLPRCNTHLPISIQIHPCTCAHARTDTHTRTHTRTHTHLTKGFLVDGVDRCVDHHALDGFRAALGVLQLGRAGQ